MSDSVQPHRQQPTRLPHPWDSPGKNTGVGCHFLLQCMKVKRESEVAQSCPTISDPMDCSPPGSSVHGIFQARVLEWGATVFSRQVTVMNNNWLGKVSKLHAIYCCWVESLILSSLILRSNFLGLLQAYWIFLFILTKCREERRLIENMWKHAYFISSITSIFLFSNSSLIITKMNKTGA